MPSVIGHFNRDNIHILIDMGYEVHVACNFKDTTVWNKKDVAKLISTLKTEGVVCHQIGFGRKPFSLHNLISFWQLNKLLGDVKYDMIHCHTPVASAVTRLAAIKFRKLGSFVIYTCHGFHFHKKASKINWMIYYPIVSVLAKFSYIMIAINKEDLAVMKGFHTGMPRYLPGVGVDIERIRSIDFNRDQIRGELGIPHNAFVILTIGELSKRKNQSVIIDAISKIEDKDIYYIICGSGKKETEYKRLSERKGVAKRVIFTGLREHEWVMKLCHVVDLGAIPSLMEGLGLAGIEIMAAGKPLVGSNVHGILDYLIDYETGISCNPHNAEEFKLAITELKHNRALYNRCKKNAFHVAAGFDIKIARKRMMQYYRESNYIDTVALTTKAGKR